MPRFSIAPKIHFSSTRTREKSTPILSRRCMNYSPQSSCSMGASWMAAGLTAVTSRSTPQSGQTMISPTSVLSARVISAAHSMQVTVDMLISFDLCFCDLDLFFHRLRAGAPDRVSLLNGLEHVEDLGHVRFERTDGLPLVLRELTQLHTLFCGGPHGLAGIRVRVAEGE